MVCTYEYMFMLLRPVYCSRVRWDVWVCCYGGGGESYSKGVPVLTSHCRFDAHSGGDELVCVHADRGRGSDKG